MIKDTVIYLAGTKLADYSDLKEQQLDNASEVETLDSTLQVDFVNYKRKWTVNWDLISFEDYETIRDKWRGQFEDSVLHYLEIPGLDIGTLVYMKISGSDIKFQGQWVEGLEVVFIETTGIS